MTIAATVLLLALAGAEDEAGMLRAGVQLREQGNDQKALEVFRQAYEKFHTPRARAQMALAEQALGRWLEAEADLEAALQRDTDAWITGNKATLEQALTVIRQRIGTLEILSNAPETAVTIDGKVVGKLPFMRPLRVAAGTVMVKVEAPGYSPAQRVVNISAEHLARESFDLVKLEVAAPARAPEFVIGTPGPAPDSDRRGWPRAVFYGGVAATALAAGLAIWSGLDVLSANNRYKSDPTKDGYDDGVNRQRRTNWLLGATVVLGLSTGGVGLFATDWR